MDQPQHRDRGSILPMVLVVIVVLGAVVAATATYASTTLRYGRTAELRIDRFAAADGALRAAIEQLKVINGNSPCLTVGPTEETFTSPVQINDATATFTCRQASAGFGSISRWALVLTGIGVLPEGDILSSQQGNGVNKKLGGPVFMADTFANDLKGRVELQNGNVYFPGAGCSADGDPVKQSETGLRPDEFVFTPEARTPVCVDPAVAGNNPRGMFPIPDLSGLAENPSYDDETYPGCRVFREGRYTSLPLAANGANFLKSGVYHFVNNVVEIQGHGQSRQSVLIGAPDAAAGIAPKLLPLAPGCQNAMVVDLEEIETENDPKRLPGATVYMDGSSRFILGNRGTLEFLPRHVSGFDWVSIQALPESTLTASDTDSPLIDVTTVGNDKELRVNGWIWAPRARVHFANVTGDDVTMELSGGSVLSKLHLGANATASEFQIAVPGTPARTTYIIRGRAYNGGTAEIEAVVEYIPPNHVAVRSWRVLN